MKHAEAVKKLRSLGTAQNRKVYARHGVTGNMFGVSYGDLGKLERAIKTDHELAEGLWATGNHDARILATMVADPARMNASKLGAWAKQVDNYVLADALVGLAAGSPTAAGLAKKWIRSNDEWTGSAGWNLLSRLVEAEDGPSDTELAGHLKTIESKIHGSKNRVRYSMNNALIAIGCRSPALQKKAVSAARRIGKVEVDHGETGCKTPDAEPYIAKIVAYRKKKTAKKAKKTVRKKA